MIVIRFADTESERRALGYLAGRFSFKTWTGGETLVPEAALAFLAHEGIPFQVEGPASYEHSVPTVRSRRAGLLPLRFNDGRPVPEELIADTVLELRQQFGAVSCETQTIRGLWQHQGQLFRDELMRLFVDAADLPEHRDYFVRFKESARVKFEQVDIWMITYPIEIM